MLVNLPIANKDRFLDIYLKETISQEEHTQKKQKLLSEKVEIREKLEAFGRKGLSRFELVVMQEM